MTQRTPTSGSLVSRRGFIKGAATTAVIAPQIISSASLGNAAAAAASERITIGHIGVGGRGTSLRKNFQDLKDAQCVAVADPFKSRREEAVAGVDEFYSEARANGSYKGCDQYNDFREILARDDIDAVVVATPDHWHVPIALAAARAGKDMYVEKPLGVSLEQDWKLRDEIKRHKNVFQYGTQQRSDRDFRFACELVRNGRIGELERVDVWCSQGGSGGSTKPIPVPKGFDYDLWLGPAPEAEYTSERCLARGGYWVYDYSLGFVAGWGVHPLDIAQWGMDADATGPVECDGTGVIPTYGLYNTIVSWDYQIRYANGVHIHFMSSDIAAPIIEAYRPEKDHGTTFFGSEGWVSVDRSGVHASPESLLECEFGDDDVRLHKSEEHRQNFIDCIRTRSETLSPIGAAVRVDTLSHLCDFSVRTRSPIRWDPEKERIVDNPEAEKMLSRPMRKPWAL